MSIPTPNPLVAAIPKGSFPASQKVFLSGTTHRDLRVPMREISLTPTRHRSGGDSLVQNDPVRVYDTSGPYTEGIEVLSNAADTVVNVVSSGARKLCFWCDDEKPKTPAVVTGLGGYNGGRNATAVPGTRGNTGGVGVSR